MPYVDTGRLGLGLPDGGALGGLGEVSGADVCPGLPSAASPVSFIDTLGACSSPAGAGLCRVIYQYAIE